MALRLLQDRAEAEDVVQETFLEAWRHGDRWDPARGPREAWLVLIARSRALDRLRARGSAARAAERARPDAEVGAPAPLELVESRQRRTRVEAALAALPAPQRQAIELAFYAGLTQGEIAARLGEPLGTVKTRVRLGMARLASALEEDAA
jgi:RNA polymerase sigma-70 factor (ECF subfamily)